MNIRFLYNHFTYIFRIFFYGLIFQMVLLIIFGVFMPSQNFFYFFFRGLPIESFSVFPSIRIFYYKYILTLSSVSYGYFIIIYYFFQESEISLEGSKQESEDKNVYISDLLKPPSFLNNETIFKIYPKKNEFDLEDYFTDEGIKDLKTYLKSEYKGKCFYCGSKILSKIFPEYTLHKDIEILEKIIPICKKCFYSKQIFLQFNDLQSKKIISMYDHIRKINSWTIDQIDEYLNYINDLKHYLSEIPLKSDNSYIYDLKYELEKI